MELLKGADYAAAEKNGIPKGTVYSRYHTLGWSKKRAITVPLQRKDKFWAQYKDVCPVSRSAFYYRLEQGMSPEEAGTTAGKKNQHG